MAFLATKGAEPIPGYRLVERLGSGGYGEVWKVMAPGELTKAIKIVHGDLEDLRSAQELKALRRIKEVRHPFLLSLERIEVIEDQLFIVTELADGSLMDRYLACQESGQRGIPREELLGYIRDAADALDYMGEVHGLQHLDVKPQNLLLVAGHIKVADFGLVKDLTGNSISLAGGMTPTYATPEAFDGRVSRQSDQYSLAIVYQEMLTGTRPFPGTTTLQLAVQHASGRPLLTPLPPRDRPVIARALSKLPEQRFRSCREMVDNLSRGKSAASAPGPAVSPTPPAEQVESSAVTRPKPPSVPATPAQPPADWESSPELLSEAELPDVESGTIPAEGDNDARVASGSLTGLRPTLFLGVGGLAGATLRRLKQRLRMRFGDLHDVPIYRMLLLDIDRSALRQAPQPGQEEALADDETLPVPLFPSDHYRDQSAELLRWLDRRWLYGVPRSLLAEGLRPLGRLALVDSAPAVLGALRESLSRIVSPEAQEAAALATGLEVREDVPRIFLVASIAGGAGSGMVLDLAYAVRQVLDELGLASDGIAGILLYATGQKPTSKELARVNAFATLTELGHFSRPENQYPGDPVHGLAARAPGQAPFEDCYLIHLGEQLDQSAACATADAVAEYLALDAAPDAGAFLDEYRRETSARAGTAVLRTMGLYRTSFPREYLARSASLSLCRQLTSRWVGTRNTEEEERVEREAGRQSSLLGLDAESLTTWSDGALRSSWQQDSTTHFAAILTGESVPDPAADRLAVASEPVSKIVARIDEKLGASLGGNFQGPTGGKDEAARKPASERGHVLGKSAIEWLIQLIETPGKRIEAAESAANWFIRHLRAEAAKIKGRLSRLQPQRLALRKRLVALQPVGRSPSLSWLKIRRRNAALPLARLLEYSRLRHEENILDTTLTLVQAAGREVARFRHDLMLARQRLAPCRTLLDTAGATTTSASDQTPIPSLTQLLPGPSHTLAEAEAAVLTGLGPEFVDAFEREFQDQVLERHGGLWALVSSDLSAPRGTQSLAESIMTELQLRARRAIHGKLASVDAATLFLEVHKEPRQAQHALQALVQSALPPVPTPGGRNRVIVALPASPAGGTLRELAQNALAGAPLTLVDSKGDVLVCHEIADLRLDEMTPALIGDTAACADLARRVMTRTDIAWSELQSGTDENGQ
jgi:serine/threonine protein kinase